MTPLCLFHQDLSNKKTCAQQLSAEVERLNQELEKIQAEKKTATDSLNQSQERIESLSQSLKMSESLLQTEKRRPSLGEDAKSNSDSTNKMHICQTQTQETSPLDQSPEASKGCNLSISHNYSTGGTDRQLSERLSELEKEVCLCVWIQWWMDMMCGALNLIYRTFVCFSVTSVQSRWSILCWNSCSRDVWRLSAHSRQPPPSPQERHFYFQNYCFISVHQFL